jgi:hypothetical protein
LKKISVLLILLPIILFGATTRAFPQIQSEGITSFHSDITVNPDSTLKVTEIIAVYCAGEQIRHGIYRDFPTRYTDNQGRPYTVGFNLLATTRDGQTEPNHQERIDNGVRVYLGDPDYLLSPGFYTYTLTYTTSRQLGFFSDHDELYWNVTGNGWIFPIEKATATVTLPAGIRPADIKVEGYTGPQGATGQDYTASVDPTGKAQFAITQPLPPYQGLTIVVSFPKGFVQLPKPLLPESLTRLSWLLVITLALLLLLGYYVWAWVKVGEDPEQGVIMVQYEPPEGLSPAAVRYIRNMGYDSKGMAAGIIDLAVKGKATITQLGREYVVSGREGTAPPPGLPEEEQYFVGELPGFGNEINFNREYSPAIASLNSSFKSLLDRLYGGGKLFRVNGGYIALGLLLTVALAVGVGWLTYQPGFSEPFALNNQGQGDIALYFFAGGIFLAAGLSMFAMALGMWENLITHRSGKLPASLPSAIILTFFSLPFTLIGLSLSVLASATYGLFILAAVMLSAIFTKLLPAYNVSGRRLLDKIEGFRRYLSAVEQDPLNRLNPPEKTPEIFEKYLPYALALEAEKAWGEQFAGVLSRAGTAGEGYNPTWYSGGDFTSFSPGSFAGSFGSGLSGAISAASTPPGSSSGGGGGGSSGGGGGGGGGGGW